jgi:hypothetical protein
LLHRRYPVSTLLRASPSPCTARPIPHGLPVEGHTPSPPRLPLLRLMSFDACRRYYPGGTAECVRRSSSSAAAAFPKFEVGRLPHLSFRGLLGVHSRFGLHHRRVAKATLYTEDSDGIVTSAAASIATGWNDPCRTGLSPARHQTPFLKAYSNCQRSEHRVGLEPTSPHYGCGVLAAGRPVPFIQWDQRDLNPHRPG